MFCLGYALLLWFTVNCGCDLLLLLLIMCIYVRIIDLKIITTNQKNVKMLMDSLIESQFY